MKITIIQHVAFETPGLINEWIRAHGYHSDLIQTFNGDSLPSADDIEFLVVLGGPMSVHDDHAWLKEERRLIRTVVTRNLPMLGICLGAQQLAMTFGAQVTPSPIEVGWGPVASSQTTRQLLKKFPRQFTALHWHGEGFEMPLQSIPLFSSPTWANQGFQFLNAIGLQFHLETTPTTLLSLVGEDREFIKQSIFDTSVDQVINHPLDPRNQDLLFQILDYLTVAAN